MIVDIWCRASGFWWCKKDSRKGFITAVEDQIEPPLLSISKSASNLEQLLSCTVENACEPGCGP